MEENWDDAIRNIANTECDMKASRIQKNYCRVGVYRGIQRGIFLDSKGFPNERGRDIIESAKHLEDEISGSYNEEDRELKMAREQGTVFFNKPQRYVVIEKVDGILTREQVAPSREIAEAIESNFIDTQTRADSEYSILTLKEAREKGYNI